MKRGWWTSLMVVGVMLIVGCEDDNNMVTQPRYEAYQPSRFFADGSSARPLPYGVWAREWELDQPRPEPSIALLARGRDRFESFCSMCHGLSGHGDGMVVLRGFPAPPTFHSPVLRNAPDAHIFHVITNGLGVMPSYRAQIPPADRWAIVAYVRALQLSQHAPLTVAPPEVQQRLTKRVHGEKGRDEP